MKIGFAFLTYNKIFNEKVWLTLSSELKKQGHEILFSCHSKRPFKSLLPLNSIPTIYTKWGDKSLIEASFLLFFDLFNRGADIVYLFSGDTLPLSRSKGFISFNQESTFCIQDKKTLRAHYDQKYYDKTKPFVGINQNLWNLRVFNEQGFKMTSDSLQKQAMFFCVNAENFREVYGHCVKRQAFKKLQKLAPMDEYFWVNLFVYFNIDFRPLSNYLYCHKNNNIDTQAQNFRMAFLREDVLSRFLFLRKLREEGAEISFK